MRSAEPSAGAVSGQRRYTERRTALIAALAKHGIAAGGRSGLGVWVPLEDEATTTQLLLERGWAVSPGERYRFRSEPGIRITATTLEPAEGERLAADLADILASGSGTHAG